MIPHLERVVDAIAAVPRGVAQSDLLAAVLEGARQGSSSEVATMLLDAVAIAYEHAATITDPTRHHGSTPRFLTGVDAPLRQVERNARRAIDLGATPLTVLEFVTNGLTGKANGPVQRAAAQAMAAAFDQTTRAAVPRPAPRSYPCENDRHPRCRGGWRAPSGWKPCPCACHERTP